MHNREVLSNLRPEELLSLRFLSILLLLCCALTAEEAIHLIRSHPNHVDTSRNLAHHPGCTPVDSTGRVLRCPVRGYGNMNFLCVEDGCFAKEPSNGLFITASEEKLIEEHFKAVKAAQEP